MITDPEEDYRRGFVPFLDCTIYLDSRPLIPRTETEYWAEKAIEAMQQFSIIYDRKNNKHPTEGGSESLRVLDIFAGSGAIGVAVLKHVPDSQVDFGEIDLRHLPTISKNISSNGIALERTRVIQTDVWSNIINSYDFILANPPYISRDFKNRVAESVLRHEPHVALFADQQGFSYIEQAILGAHGHLTENGIMYIEHEPEQVERIAKTAKAAHLKFKSYADQYGILRYSTLTRVA